MNIAVLGYGKEGKAAVNYWNNGNQITVCDIDESVTLPDFVAAKKGSNYLQGLDQFDLIVRSPQIHPKDIVANNSPTILDKVTTGTEEFMRHCPAPIIGVTGTKGKGTTSSLITEILRNAGYTVHLGGNIGTAALTMLENNIQPEDWVVLELSNFQLIDCHVSPKIAVCLMIVPEHLDWHTNMQEYVLAKQNIFRYQNEQDFAVFDRLSEYSMQAVSVTPAFGLSYEVPPHNYQPKVLEGSYVLGDTIYMDDTAICKTNDVALLGRHNLENVCGAITAIWDIIDQRHDVIVDTLKTFTGLAHRIEPVRLVNNVWYYNDSFSSAAAATIAAIDSIHEPKVMIIGGYDRGIEVSALISRITRHPEEFRTIILIGQTAPMLARELAAQGFLNYQIDTSGTMQHIVQTSFKLSLPGDAVILSPGHASFDMFKNFEDRGLQFKAQVQSL